MTLSDKILEACIVPSGLSLSELTEVVNDSTDTVNSMAGLMSRQGRLYKTGVRKFFRYFTNEADAKAWELVAEDAYIEHKRLLGRLKRQRRAERDKAGAAFKPPAPKAPPKPKPPKKRAEIIYRREVKEAPVQAKNIIWPEHVKVYVHPTPPGRFEFQPPAGWKGQITQDQMDMRLQNVSSA